MKKVGKLKGAHWRIPGPSRAGFLPADATKVPDHATAAGKDPRGCRWIIGDPKTDDWCYCQKPLARDTPPYCDEHLPRSFATAEERKAWRVILK